MFALPFEVYMYTCVCMCKLDMLIKIGRINSNTNSLFVDDIYDRDLAMSFSIEARVPANTFSIAYVNSHFPPFYQIYAWKSFLCGWNDGVCSRDGLASQTRSTLDRLEFESVKGCAAQPKISAEKVKLSVSRNATTLLEFHTTLILFCSLQC